MKQCALRADLGVELGLQLLRLLFLGFTELGLGLLRRAALERLDVDVPFISSKDWAIN